MRGPSVLVMGVVAVAAAACSEMESMVGIDEDTDGRTLVVSAQSTTVQSGGSTTITFRVTEDDGAPVKDGTEVEVTSVKLGRVEASKLSTRDGTAATTYRAPSAPGTDQLEAKSGDARAGLSLTIAQAAPAQPPPSSGGATDSIDLNSVTWLHTNVSGWAETSRITNVSVGAPPICIEHTKAGQWPVKDGLEGNPWVFVNQGGRWYAATYEWLAPGQTCKAIHADNIGSHIGIPPLSSWRPQSGELVGFMVSARARSGGGTPSPSVATWSWSAGPDRSSDPERSPLRAARVSGDNDLGWTAGWRRDARGGGEARVAPGSVRTGWRWRSRCRSWGISPFSRPRRSWRR